MGKMIAFDPEEIKLLKGEISYLIKSEKAELQKLLSARQRSMVPNKKSNDEFITNSREFLNKLQKIYSKLKKYPQ